MRLQSSLLLAAALWASAVSAAPPSTPSVAAPRVIAQPCSVRKICQELSRRFQTPVSATPELLETRVTWSFSGDRTLDSTVASLAELTDSLVANVGTPEKRRLRLERRQPTARMEAAWRREAAARTIDNVLRASEPPKGEKLDLSRFSLGNRFLLQRSPEICRYLRLITPPLLDRLLAEEQVRFPQNTVDEAQIRETAQRVWGRISHGADDAEVGPVSRRVENTMESVRKHGLGMHLRTDWPGASVLMLDMGREVGTALCHFSDEELGLPNRRTNPYRLLESNLRTPTRTSLPAFLQRPLPADLRVPSDALWHSTLRELGQITGAGLVTDGYLARKRSRLSLLSRLAPGAVLARRGTPLAEALDTICEPFQYLWWEKNGTVYFRSRAWAWDVEPEPPDDFVDAWETAVERKSVEAPQLAALNALKPRQWHGLSTLGWNAALPQKYPKAVREFIGLFARATPAERSRLLGTGLTLSPEQTRAKEVQNLFLQITAFAGEGPVNLRLGFSAPPDPAHPECSRVKLALIRKWTNKTDQIEFDFDLPRTAEPFPR